MNVQSTPLFFLPLFFYLLRASESPVSIDQVEPFFSNLVDSLLYRNIYKAVSESDFNLAKKLLRDFPLQTLRVIRNFGSPIFSTFFAMIICARSFSYYKKQDFGLLRQGVLQIEHTFSSFQYLHTFSSFQYLIEKNLKYDLGESDFIVRKKIIRIILSILRRVDCSSKKIYVDYKLFTSRSMSTKTFIRSYSYFVEELESDCVIGFENSYRRLKDLSKIHKGIIPPEGPLRARILSIIFACAHYANCIERKGFEHLDPKTTDPGMLSFILGFQDKWKNTMEYHFRICGTVRKENTELIPDFKAIKGLLDKYGFENHAHRRSLVQKILPMLNDRQQWSFKVYLRLSYGISI